MERKELSEANFIIFRLEIPKNTPSSKFKPAEKSQKLKQRTLRPINKQTCDPLIPIRDIEIEWLVSQRQELGTLATLLLTTICN
jgi:hypothetical protein